MSPPRSQLTGIPLPTTCSGAGPFARRPSPSQVTLTSSLPTVRKALGPLLPWDWPHRPRGEGAFSEMHTCMCTHARRACACAHSCTRARRACACAHSYQPASTRTRPTQPCTLSRDYSSCSCLSVLFQVWFPYQIGKWPSVCNSLCWRQHGKQTPPHLPEPPMPRTTCQCPRTRSGFCSAPRPSHFGIFPETAYLCTHTPSSRQGTHTMLL